MDANAVASAIEYDRVARVVGFSISIIRRREQLSNTDQRIISDLERVYIGLKHEAARCRGITLRMVSGEDKPQSITVRPFPQ